MDRAGNPGHSLEHSAGNESDSSRGLLHRLSHALKNDLHSITLNLEALRSRLTRSGSPDQQEALLRHLDIALTDVRRLQARIEGGTRLMDVEAPSPQQTTAERIVKRAMQEIRSLALQSKIAVTVSGESNAPLFVDEGQLAHALSEVVRNAIEAADPASPVTIRLRQTADAVEIAVANSGEPGLLATDVLPPPFHSSKSGHAGVGLALIEKLLQQNHGSLRITVGAGSTEVALVLSPARE